jgi:DtxR family transcriptional regulator, Mn-dependent transcriptional regulator
MIASPVEWDSKTESPLFNLAIFVVIVAVTVALFWPRIGLVQAVRSRMRVTERTRLEDALKYAFDSDFNDRAVTNSSLAKALHISSAKGSALVDHMVSAGLVSPLDGHILLTEEGRRYALQIIRAHRLWERYLADETGIEPQEWHTRAEEYEHLLSQEETDALSDRLGNPRFDPHGDQIPSADGALIPEKQLTLLQLGVGECATISHMEDEPEGVYSELVNLEIYLSMELRLKAKTEDLYIIESEGREFELTPEAAQNLSLKPIAELSCEENGQPFESLADLQSGEKATVRRISPACRGFERRRLMDLGILPGTSIEFCRNGLTGGLTAFHARGTILALRTEQSRMISVRDRERIGA